MDKPASRAEAVAMVLALTHQKDLVRAYLDLFRETGEVYRQELDALVEGILGEADAQDLYRALEDDRAELEALGRPWPLVVVDALMFLVSLYAPEQL